MEMPGRIQVRAVVRGQRDPLGGGGLAVGIILGPGAGQHGHEFRQGVGMLLVGDLRRQRRRVGEHVVFQIDGQIDEAMAPTAAGCGHARASWV
jgi:hypothetical protein